jgi:hypothetical protein
MVPLLQTAPFSSGNPAKAFSSEVETGSRQENASNQECRKIAVKFAD